MRNTLEIRRGPGTLKVQVEPEKAEWLDPQVIHEAGARRHGAHWLSANQTALEIAAKYFDPSQPIVKEFLPYILLRVLDNACYARGLTWDKEARAWKKVERVER